eukprot:TRINITY_DN27603_c0_g1_i1.p1 TRINITY_DN27603_c0_g1~~TRINITY_DN27603_c0_g1_i1.p1  ORF type:complete len:190 (-),score=30.69 TRINITY_DN27603_c0_g1_i1:91-660(-)
MEVQPVVLYSGDGGEFIETLNGNRISRKSILCGTQNIRLAGKVTVQQGAMVRGDLANVNVGKFCRIGDNVVLRPCYKRYKGGMAFFPQSLGECVTIDDDTVVDAASIGSFVHIGKRCIIGQRSIIKDCARILDDTVLAPDSVVPPFSVVSGCPGRWTEELPESWQETQRYLAVSYHEATIVSQVPNAIK